jgi:hypothetical protein
METDVLREALAEPPTADELRELPDEELLHLRRDNEALRAESARLQAEVSTLRRELQRAEEDFAERLTQLLNASLLRLRESAEPECAAGHASPVCSDVACAGHPADAVAAAVDTAASDHLAA